MQPRKMGRLCREAGLFSMYDFFKCWHHGSVAQQHDLLLCIVPPPSIWMIKILYKLTCRFIEHLWFFRLLVAIIYESINSAVSRIFLQAFFFNFFSEIGTRSCPVTLLDNTAMHINDVKISVRAGIGIHRSEVHIGRGDELLAIICILNDGLTFQ